jgi:hypothetical protein
VTNPQNPPQGPSEVPIQQLPATEQRNVIGLIAIAAAIIGFVFACIPGALIVGWVMLPVAFILGIVGVLQSGRDKGTSIAAICVSVVGVIVGAVVFLTVVGDAVDEALSESGLSPATTASGEGEKGSSAKEDTPKAGSRENPLPIGEAVSDDEWTIVLGQPQEAWGTIEAENSFNEPPESGMEYWIVPVKLTYTGSESGQPMLVTVKFVGSDNRTYSDTCGVIPDPLYEIGELYNGGSAEGNACLAVPAGADGLWTVTTGFGDPVFFTAKP